MVRERRNIFLRVFQRLKRPFKSFASRHSRRWNNVVRCCEEDMDDSTTNIICIPEDEKYYQYTTAVCVSGMTHDEQHHRTCNHFAINVLFSSSIEQEQIKRLYISTAKIERSDDSSSCVHSKHQLPDSNIDSKEMVGHKLPDSTERPAVTVCRKNSVNKLSLDELEDNSDSEMAACDKSDHTSTSLDTGNCSIHSFKEVDTEDYPSYKTWTCQSESLTSTTTKVMETECYETSGSLSELSLSSSTLHLDASVLNSDLSEDPFYDVRSERDVDENCEKLDSLSPDDICKKIESKHLKVYTEPFFDEVEDEVIEKSEKEHFNKELRRKNPGETCLHDTKHQGKSRLIRKNSYRHFNQCQFNVVSIQNDIGFNCFIKSSLCLQLIPLTQRLNKHQLGKCVAMNVSALQVELVTGKNDLGMSGTALSVNSLEKLYLERWDSNWILHVYLKHSLIREECHLYYKKGRDSINQNGRQCIDVIYENSDIRTRDIDSCNSSKNVVCTRQYDDIFQLLTGCFNNEDLNYIRNLYRIKVDSILARVNEDIYTNIKLLKEIDNLVLSTNPLLSDRVLPKLCNTNMHVCFGQSRNNLGDLLLQSLHNEEELSNKRVTKLLLEVERNHCDIIPIPLKFMSSDTRLCQFMTSDTRHLLFTSSETRHCPITSSEIRLHPITSSDTRHVLFSSLYTRHYLFMLLLVIIYDSLAEDKETNFTKSVQIIKIVNKKGNCEVESDSVKTICQENETIECLLTSDSSLTTFNLCDQLRSDRGGNQVIEDYISGGDLNDSGITYNDTGNNEKDFHGNRITKDSNTVCDNEPNLNCNGNSHHLNHTGDSRSDSDDSETTNHSNVNIDNETHYNDTVHGHNRNDTGYNKTDFNRFGISQSPVVIGNNETDIFNDSETAIESNGTEVIDVNHNARRDISDCNRPSCTKDKRYLKKLLWKFYKKNKHNEHFVGKRKVVIRKCQKHPPPIEFLVKSFFKELEKDPNLKTFNKSKKDWIYKILNQRFANDCYLYPLEQKLPVGGTLERENVRDEHEIQNQNPPESVPEDVERTEESANEGLGAYFYEMQQSTRPTLEETMRFELMRLKSFWSFPRNINVSPIMLAKWGFYYTGNCAETRCFSCTASYRDWDDGDNPEQVHHRISPHCPFLTGIDARNVTSYRAGDRPSATQGSSESRSRRLVTPSTEAQSTRQGNYDYLFNNRIK